jgi:hypothetical protein
LWFNPAVSTDTTWGTTARMERGVKSRLRYDLYWRMQRGDAKYGLKSLLRRETAEVWMRGIGVFWMRRRSWGWDGFEGWKVTVEFWMIGMVAVFGYNDGKEVWRMNWVWGTSLGAIGNWRRKSKKWWIWGMISRGGWNN